jgi:ribosomal protein L19
MNYFVNFTQLKKNRKFLKKRSAQRKNFEAGDILSPFFRDSFSNFYFEGFCLFTRKIKTPDFSFMLRNVLQQIIVEIVFSFFYDRLFFYKLNDYKRKTFTYGKAKLYFLRKKSNTFTSVSMQI